MAQMMTKRIPVSVEMWKQLGKLKEAGQTYDDLLEDLLHAYNRRDLARFAKSAKSGTGKWTSLEDV